MLLVAITSTSPPLLFRHLSIFLRSSVCAAFCVVTERNGPKTQERIPGDHKATLLTMCIQVIERFSVCKCVYYRHSVDPCPARAQRGHGVQEKTVYVGYACDRHARDRAISRSNRHRHRTSLSIQPRESLQSRNMAALSPVEGIFDQCETASINKEQHGLGSAGLHP